LPERPLGLKDHVVIALVFAHLDEFERVGQVSFQGPVTADAFFQARPLAHQFLRISRIAPKIGVFSQCIQFVETLDRGIPVKDASLAAQETA